MKVSRGEFGKRLLNCAVQCLLLVGLAGLTQAQSQDQTPQRGFHPAGSYALTELETINTVGGDLMYRVPLASLPAGRGGSPGARVGLFYNSKLYDTQTEFQYNQQSQLTALSVLTASQEGGWRYGFRYELRLEDRWSQYPYGGYPQCPSAEAYQVYKLKMSFPDGSVREFRPYGYTDFSNDGFFQMRPDGWVQNCNYPLFGSWTYGPVAYFSTDGSYLRLEVQHDDETGQWWNNPWTLNFPDGSRVTFNEPGSQGQRIYDRNNNFTEVRSITYNGHAAHQIIDQLNRSIIVEYDPMNYRDYVHAVGYNNQALDWTVKWGFTNVLKDYYPAGYGQSEFFRELNIGFYVVDEVVLPSQAGALSYRFGYNGSPTYTYPVRTNGWGELSSLTLPSEAQETIPARATYQYYHDGHDQLQSSEVLQNHPTRRELTYKREYDGTSTSTTEVNEYRAADFNTCAPYLFCGEVRTPDGGSTKDYITNTGAWDRKLVYKTERPDGTVVERIWQQNVPYSMSVPLGWAGVNSYVKTEFVSVKDAGGTLVKTAIKDYSYDKNGNVTQTVEYDWVAYASVPRSGGVYNRPTGIPAGATVKRVTANTLYHPTPDASNNSTDDPDVYHRTTAPRLRNVVESTEVRPNLSGGAAVARTEYFYDNPSTTGNLTEQKSWDSTKGVLTQPLSPTNSISVTHAYDLYGNRLRTTDARGNVQNPTVYSRTEYVYGDIDGQGHTNLYPTQIRVADNDASKRRTTNLTYDFHTGLTKQSTDADNNVAVRTGYDVFGRPTLVEDLDGTTVLRGAATEYSDTLRRVISRRDLSAVGDRKLVSVMHYDQLGRVRLSRTLEDSTTQSPSNEEHGLKVQTRYTYSGTNSYQLVSNPYRAATSSAASGEYTMGWSRTKLDQGGRVIESQTFGGATLPAPWGANTTSTGTVTTAYDADRVLVTDQAGKQRISETNALGQLGNVWEIRSSDVSTVGVTFPGYPSIAAGYQTSYQYDALNNLTTVTQSGQAGGQGVTQTRTFAYSSLSRLISATNPESGTTTYGYDPNGNLTGKTDARAITATYQYDALNRSTQVTYSSYPTGTRAVAWFYDNPDVSKKGKGKLWYNTSYNAKWEQGGNNLAYQRRIVEGYDALGRPTSQTQGFLFWNTAISNYEWKDYRVQRTYDLANNVKTQTYPSNRTVTYGHDAAGRLSSFAGTLGDGVSRSYADLIGYNAVGRMVKERFGQPGMTTPLFHRMHYNNRLQLFDIRLGTDASAVNDDDNPAAWTNGSRNRGALEFYHSSDYAFGNGGANNNGNLYRQEHVVPGDDAVSSWAKGIDTYSYDALNRVLSVSEERASNTQGATFVYSQAFDYDRWGNRTINLAGTTAGVWGVTRLAQTIQAATNRMTAVESLTLGYDAVGNQTTYGALQRWYDAENKLTKASEGSGNWYYYDADGQRARRVVGTSETWLVYGLDGELVAEYPAEGAATAPQQEYGYRAGQLLVVVPCDGGVRWLVADHLGSPRIAADGTGSLGGIRRHDYLPFGEEVLAGHRIDALGQPINGYVTADCVRQRFTGHERDTETVLDFAQARYFSSVQGRFTGVDSLLSSAKPNLPQTWNRYAYTLNNPLKYTDPLGLYVFGADVTDEQRRLFRGNYSRHFLIQSVASQVD
jgi:RHS repeat-associated protein